MAKGKPKSILWELQNRVDKTAICDKCKNVTTCTVDHIFPASLLNAWGLNEEVSTDEENLQLLCPKCQLLKTNRFDFHNPKTIYLIEKYINKLKQKYL